MPWGLACGSRSARGSMAAPATAAAAPSGRGRGAIMSARLFEGAGVVEWIGELPAEALEAATAA
eukprot:13748191-Alexandrium_andersonii.AAC.1